MLLWANVEGMQRNALSQVPDIYREQQLWYKWLWRPRSRGMMDLMKLIPGCNEGISRSSHRFDRAVALVILNKRHEAARRRIALAWSCVNEYRPPKRLIDQEYPETTSLSIVEYDVYWGGDTLRGGRTVPTKKVGSAERNKCCSSTRAVCTIWIGIPSSVQLISVFLYTRWRVRCRVRNSLLIYKLFSPASVVPQRYISHPGIQSDGLIFAISFLRNATVGWCTDVALIILSIVKHHSLHSTLISHGRLWFHFKPNPFAAPHAHLSGTPLGKENTGTSYQKKCPLRCMAAIVFPLDYESLRTSHSPAH